LKWETKPRFYSTSIDKKNNPTVVYLNADLDKIKIFKENKQKSGYQKIKLNFNLNKFLCKIKKFTYF